MHLVALARRLAESEEHREGRPKHEEVARVEGQRRPTQRKRPRRVAPRAALRIAPPRGVSSLGGGAHARRWCVGRGGLAVYPPVLGEVLMGDEIEADDGAEGVREEGDLP